MADVATSPSDLLARLAGSAHLDGDRLVIDDEAAFRDAGIRDLAWTAAFSIDEATIEAAQWLIWEASEVLGARSASIQGLYDARARGEVSGFSVPAINRRAQTFDMARTVYEAAQAADVGAVILEIARSEQTYTFQRPIDFATASLAGAAMEIEIIGAGEHQIPVAIVPFGGDDKLAQTINSVVTGDLLRSGLFRLIDPAGKSPHELDEVGYPDWQARGADA